MNEEDRDELWGERVCEWKGNQRAQRDGIYLFNVIVRSHKASAADDAGGANGVVGTCGGGEVGFEPADVVNYAGEQVCVSSSKTHQVTDLKP